MLSRRAADPPFDALQARLLPIADMVMLVMLSRPENGSLRSTWVTWVTIVLALTAAAGIAVIGVVLVQMLVALGPVWMLLELPLLSAMLACIDLGVYGLRQRTLTTPRRV